MNVENECNSLDMEDDWIDLKRENIWIKRELKLIYLGQEKPAKDDLVELGVRAAGQEAKGKKER